MKRLKFLFFIFLVVLQNYAFSQSNGSLKKQLQDVAVKHKAKIGLGIIHIESGDTLTLGNGLRYPMLSVYKFPLALAVMNQVDRGNLKLDQLYHVETKDLLDETWSPLKKQYPNGNVDLTIAQLLEYSVGQSDNIACDILFGLVKGTDSVNRYIHSLGIRDIQIVATEHEMKADWKIQYSNWSTPIAMSRLLEGFYLGKYLSKSSNEFLMKLMTESTSDSGRIKGLLPEGTSVAHKTGTSGGRNNCYDACNDVGIISLPDGTHVALSVLVSGSCESYDDTRRLIAELSKIVFDYYSSRKNENRPAKSR